jgi:hypothetical protein
VISGLSQKYSDVPPVSVAMHPHWHLASTGPAEQQTEKARKAATSGSGGSENDASGNDAGGNDASGNDASGNDASGNDASGNDASGNDASGNDGRVPIMVTSNMAPRSLSRYAEVGF